MILLLIFRSNYVLHFFTPMSVTSTIQDTFHTENVSTRKNVAKPWNKSESETLPLDIELYLHNIRSVKRLIFDWLEGSFETFYTWKESNCAEDGVLRPKRWSWKAVKWSCRTFDGSRSWNIFPASHHLPSHKTRNNVLAPNFPCFQRILLSYYHKAI